MLGGCTAHTGGCREPKALYLCLDGSGRAQFCLALIVCCGLWHHFANHPVPPTYTTPHLNRASVTSCVCVHLVTQGKSNIRQNIQGATVYFFA